MRIYITLEYADFESVHTSIRENGVSLRSAYADIQKHLLADDVVWSLVVIE